MNQYMTQNIHNVEATHVDVVIHVYDKFATVDITIGTLQTVLFTKDERMARAIVAMLGMATTDDHTDPIPQNDEALV